MALSLFKTILKVKNFKFNKHIRIKKDAPEYNSDEKQLLENRIKQLTETLNEQVEKNKRLTQELDDVKSDFKSINDKNSELISQLEMDNNEIKKRLVKLIK